MTTRPRPRTQLQHPAELVEVADELVRDLEPMTFAPPVTHVYNPLGIPWLLAAGVIWGYWRVAGGGVILTMVLHFSHNALMIWLQGLL